MYIITYKGKPATMKKIYEVEGRLQQKAFYDMNYIERELFISGPKKFAIAHYLHHVGFTWGQRAKGIECVNIGA